MEKAKITAFNTQVSIHFHSKRYRLADADGLSVKAVLDGLVNKGLFIDDSPKYIRSITQTQEKIPKSEKEVTIITITY